MEFPNFLKSYEVTISSAANLNVPLERTSTPILTRKLPDQPDDAIDYKEFKEVLATNMKIGVIRGAMQIDASTLCGHVDLPNQNLLLEPKNWNLQEPEPIMQKKKSFISKLLQSIKKKWKSKWSKRHDNSEIVDEKNICDKKITQKECAVLVAYGWR